MKSIPVIGTPVVKNTKWVRRLYHSIDYPVDNFFIINNNGKGEIDEDLDLLKTELNPWVKKFWVTHMPSNIGVSASWNLIIKSFMLSEYWVIVNDDVAFTPGLLQELATEAEDKEVGLINPNPGDFNLGAWDFFLIKDWVIKSHGLFDENFYPAYCEDADYIMRLLVKPIKRKVGLSNRYLHGDGFSDEYYQHGSQTSKTSPELEDTLNRVNLTNFTYAQKKWGEGWRSCEPFSNPFNNNTLDISYTTWDLDFVRSKHLGF
jgi:hypothetical protein